MKQTICLNMIVKNEAHLIADSLNKLTNKVLFDYWVISDTGSTDGTQDIIRSFFQSKGIPGELVEHAWQDFGYNRTKALECAYNKTDYLLVFDADDELCGPFSLPFLTADGYKMNFGDETGISYSRCALVNNRKKWCYKGVLHEYIECLDPVCNYANLDGTYYIVSGKRGSRSLDPEKYYKDALVLEKAHAKALAEKDDLYIRYAFYCANSFKDCGRHEDSVKWYKITLSQPNWTQEKYIACLRIFEASSKLGNKEVGIYHLVESFKYDSKRVECIYHLVQHYCSIEMPEIAKLYYSLVKTWYETSYLTTINFSEFLFIIPAIYSFYLPYFMIIVNAKLKTFSDGFVHYRIIFNKKYTACGDAFINNLLHNFNLYIPTLVSSSIDKIGFLTELLEYIECAKWNNIAIKPEYIMVVDNLIKELRPTLTKLPLIIPDNIKSSRKDVQVFLSITTCKRLDLFKQTMNSILNTWTDLHKVNYFFCVDDLSNKNDREYMQNTYPFIKFYLKEESEKGHRSSMNIIWKTLKKIKPKYWIHLEDDWLFFKRDEYVSKGIRLLEQHKSKGIHQLLFNRNYAETYSVGDGWDIQGGQTISRGVLEHVQSNTIAGPNCGYWPHYSFRPSIVSVDTILGLGNFDSPNTFFERDYANKYAERGYKSAFLNGISCMHIGKLTSDKTGTNAYTLNNISQFSNATKTATTTTPIKIINLLRRPDRKTKMNELFQRHRIKNYEFVPAVDGSTLELTYKIYKLFKGNDFGNRKGFIGCALSHYVLWEMLVNSNDSRYIIFEDDIQIEPEFGDKLEQIQKEITNQTDILYLGLSTYDQNDPIKRATVSGALSAPLNRNSYIGGFFGYIITRKGATTMLDYISKNGIRHGIDYLPKIMPNLVCISAQPNIVFSEVVCNGSTNQDSNIQLDLSTFNFGVVSNSMSDWEFIQGKDMIGNDILHGGKLTVEEYIEQAYFMPTCVAFNTLGFFKHTISELVGSPYFKQTDGIYVRKSSNETCISSRKIRVRMMGNYWPSSKQLCDEWNNLTKGNYTWNNIQFTWETNNIDYYVIINMPCNNDYFNPARTIVFHMEPWCYDPRCNWGVKTWGYWAEPDESKFLSVRSHKNACNVGFWQLRSSYTELKNATIIEKYDHSIISTICSSKYFDDGHIKRINFLKYIEERNDPVVSFHYYNHDNTFNFKNYMGIARPNIDKERGIMKYKYYFMCENNAEHNFITEKLWEPILCQCLCFYWGCPNVADHVDPRTFVQLDMNDFEKSFEIIKQAIQEDWWQQRLPFIMEERTKILEYHAFCPTVERIINAHIKKC
jgi:GR25 family glycosyltransferase involved in LPS biosynthesis